MGEHSFYREHDIQLSEYYSPDDQESYLLWASTQQCEQGKWPLFEPVLETEMEEAFPVGCAVSLLLLPLAHYPICPSSHAVCCFWTTWILKVEEGRFPNMLIIVYQSVLSSHSILEPHQHHCKNLKTFKDLFCSSVMSVAICFVQFWHLTIQWCGTDDPSV